MHPILFRYGFLTLYTYGFFLALAFLGAIFIAGREARRLGLPVETFFDLCFYTVVAALVGSRLMYVLLELRTYLAHPLQIFAIWGGGLDFQGGVILALVVAVWFIRRHSLPWRPTLDALALGLPVGQFLGRIGCFSAGCCYGSPSSLPWAVLFTNPATLCPLRVPVHPAQLYEAFLDLGVVSRRSASGRPGKVTMASSSSYIFAWPERCGSWWSSSAAPSIIAARRTLAGCP